MCQSLFLSKAGALSLQLVLKKRLTQVFSCEFCEICRNIFFTENKVRYNKGKVAGWEFCSHRRCFLKMVRHTLKILQQMLQDF